MQDSQILLYIFCERHFSHLLTLPFQEPDKSAKKIRACKAANRYLRQKSLVLTGTVRIRKPPDAEKRAQYLKTMLERTLSMLKQSRPLTAHATGEAIF